MFYHGCQDRAPVIGLRHARTGRHVGDGTTRDSVASIPQQQRIDWLDGFDRQRRSPNCDKPIPGGNSDLALAALEGALHPKPEIELPDQEGFLAALILRLVRRSNRSGLCGTETRSPVSRGCIAHTMRTRRRLPAEPAGTARLNRVADPLSPLVFVELAYRRAQVFAAKGRPL